LSPQYVAEVQRSRAALERELGALGLYYWPSRANFVLVRIGPAYAEFIQALRARGILVRDRHTDPRCEGCVAPYRGIGETHADSDCCAARGCPRNEASP